MPAAPRAARRGCRRAEGRGRARLPGGFGLDQLPPGFDPSQAQVPEEVSDRPCMSRGRLPADRQLDLVDPSQGPVLEPARPARPRSADRLDPARACRRALPRRALDRPAPPTRTRPSSRPGPNRDAGALLCATAGRRSTTGRWQPRTTCPGWSGPAGTSPGHAATSANWASRSRPDELRPRSPAGSAAATAGSRSSATGSTASLGDLAPSGPTTCWPRRSRSRTPAAPGSPPTCSARTRCPA